MNNNEVRVRQVMADVFSISTGAIDDETSIDTVERWDSLSHLNLILALEQEFGISFTEEQTVELMNFPLIKVLLSEHGVTF